MHINLIPQRRDETLTLSRDGDVLTLNGETLDLSSLPEGATLPADAIDSPWIAGPVERVGGALRLSLILPHGPDAPHETLFPEPVHAAADGPVPLPPYDASPPVPAEPEQQDPEEEPS